MVERKEPVVAKMNLSQDDKIVVGVHMGEFKRALRDGIINPGSSFEVKNKLGKKQIVISSVGIGVPSTVLMKASIKLSEMTGKGQLQNAKIGPDDVIIKKLR